MRLSDIWKTPAFAVAMISLNACSLVHHKPATEPAVTPVQAALSVGDYQRGITALKAGKDQDALNLFDTVTKSHPDLAAPYINVGLIEIKRGNLHSAETALLHAATLAPEQPEVYNGLGIIYRRLGRFGDAEAAYLKALHIAPDYANAHINIGILYEIYLNNLGAALEHYERYQAITGDRNELVKKWIIDVSQRLARNTGAKK